MKISAFVVAGVIFALLAVAVFVFVASQSPFPAFKYSTQTSHYIDVNSNVGPADSRFMWTNNDLTLVAQAFVLFAAAAAALAMLKTDDKEDSDSE